MCKPGRPITPDCIVQIKQRLKKLEKIANELDQLNTEIKRNITILENPKPSTSNPSPMAEGSGNTPLLENGETENENFSELFEKVIKRKSANLSEVIVDLIITNQVDDNPDRIREIRLETEKFLKDLTDIEIADTKPESKKEISDRMKANISAMLEKILAH